MNILLVEDSSFDAESVQENLEEAFPGLEFRHVKTESDFRSSFELIKSDPPDVIIMDVMVRWADPALDMPAMPPEVRAEGYYRAGVRCQRLLAEDEATAGIPVIMYSVLGREDLHEDLRGAPRNVMYLSKAAGLMHLIQMIRSCVPTYSPARPVKRMRIFIGHGHSHLWARVQLFLEKDLGIAAFSYESESHVSESIVSVLEGLAKEADFAVLILTGEDETAVGARRARQNVVHEAGLFQGKLGFRKVVLLLQEGLEGFTNVDGLQAIPFAGDRIEQTFFELQRVLKREKIL